MDFRVVIGPRYSVAICVSDLKSDLKSDPKSDPKSDLKSDSVTSVLRCSSHVHRNRLITEIARCALEAFRLLTW